MICFLFDHFVHGVYTSKLSGTENLQNFFYEVFFLQKKSLSINDDVT
jgi:hypothetical protein